LQRSCLQRNEICDAIRAVNHFRHSALGNEQHSAYSRMLTELTVRDTFPLL
jgi:hypothetical protein